MDILSVMMEFDIYEWNWHLFMDEFYTCNDLVWTWFEFDVCMELNLDTCNELMNMNHCMTMTWNRLK